ncbi:Kelch repeat-containing protein [Filimonas lacunae]|nr:kelch repeat-containing protein [Filimonas lacunae]
MKNSLLILSTACVALIMGSCNKSSDTPDTEEGNWVKRGSFDGPARTGAVSFVINDTAYVGTGYNKSVSNSYVNADSVALANNGYLKDFWKFNMPATSTGNTQTGYTWTQVEELPGEVRAYAVGFNIQNKGYVGCGIAFDGLKLLKDFYEFDGNTWTAKASFAGSARINATGFGLGNKGYITCGYDGANTLKDNYQYNPATNSWTSVEAIAGGKRRGASVFVYKDKAYLFCGYSSSTYLDDMWAFDSTTLKWTEKNRITNATDNSFDDDYSDIYRQNANTFVIDNYGYLTAGDQGGTLISKTWRYDFVNDTWIRRTSLERTQRTYAVGFTVHNRGFVGTGVYGSTSYLEDFQEFIPSQTYEAND